MRYEKPERLLRLALDMQAQADGVSLTEIMQRYSVSRRTAERMRDAVMAVFPAIEEVSVGERLKRWRLPRGSLDRLVAVSADDLAALETAAELLDRQALPLQAASVRKTLGSLRLAVRPEQRRRIDNDFEALTVAEGLASRPGPRLVVDSSVLMRLRHAIRACEVVVLTYRGRQSGARSWQRVAPYGFLYGRRNYLVAFSLNERASDYRLFSLPNIAQVELAGEIFERDPAFDVGDYAARSFGVFQEPPSQVVWRFAPAVAQEAAEWLFHPRQAAEQQPDGSLIVRFEAGGLLEMAWHLFTWGQDVEVIEPLALRQLLAELKRA